MKDLPRVPDRAEYSPDYFESLLTEEEAARFLKHSVRALQNWRTRGGKDPGSRGPKYVGRARAVRYRRRDLIAWIEANLVEHTPEKANSPNATDAEGGATQAAQAPAEPQPRPESTQPDAQSADHAPKARPRSWADPLGVFD